jgi:hypothetical protein
MKKFRRSTLQRALACAISALVCGVVAIVTGYHIGYGIAAGLIAGYLAYEFRDVRKAIPIAYRATCRGSVSIYSTNIARLQAWRARPHPFVYPALLISAPFFGRVMFSLMSGITQHDFPRMGTIFQIVINVVAILVGPLGWFEASFAVLVPLVLIAFIGARAGEQSYWWPLLLHYDTAEQAEEEATKLEARGLRRQPLTYRNVARWTAEGIGLIVLFFVWTLWKHLVINAVKVLVFIARFLWTLIQLIHSHERVLYAVAGTLGGVIAYSCFIRPEHSIAQNAVAVLFGMVLGVGVGHVDHEFVSPWFHKHASVPATTGGE